MDTGQEYPVQQAHVRIGRDADCDIRLGSQFVSRQHAQLDNIDGVYSISVDSTNKTFVDGIQVAEDNSPYRLESGATITVADVELRFYTGVLMMPPAPATHTPAASIARSVGFPTGCATTSTCLISMLPECFQHDAEAGGAGVAEFLTRYLALIESVHLPIAWTVDNFDLYLDVHSTPDGFLDWFGSWYATSGDDPLWNGPRRRQFLCEAWHIFATRGTPAALCRAVELYVGSLPVIIETEQPPQTFRLVVKAPPSRPWDDDSQERVRRFVAMHIPAHTVCEFEFQ